METELIVLSRNKRRLNVPEMPHAWRDVITGNLLRQREVILIMARFRT